MRINKSSNINKKTFNLGQIKGVDVTSSPLNVKQSRASYMRNMINEGGVNKKRNGHTTIALFTDDEGNGVPINGIFDYKDTSSEIVSSYKVVHAGTQFFKCDENFANIEKINIRDGTSVLDQKSQAFYDNNKLWIICCGDYLVYDGSEVQAVKESMYAYVPTTAIFVADTAHGGGYSSFEAVNLFTKKRINKLIGRKGNGRETFRLDGKIDFAYPITVSAEAYCGGKEADSEFEIKTWYYKTSELANAKFYAAVSGNNSEDSGLRSILDDTGIEAYESTEITIDFMEPFLINRLEIVPQDNCYVPFVRVKYENNTGEVIYNGTSFTERVLISDAVGKAVNQIILSSIKTIGDAASTVSDDVKAKNVIINGHILQTGNITLDYTLNGTPNGFIATETEPIITNDEGINVCLYDYDIKASAYSYEKKTTGSIAFNSCLPSPLEEMSNISVTYYASYEEKHVNARLGCELIFGKVNKILVFADGDNLVRYSSFDSSYDGKVSDYGYIPDNQFIEVSEGKEKITAIVALGNRIVAFKTQGSYFVDFSITSNDEEQLVVINATLSGVEKTGCENQFVSAIVNQDTLIFSKNGVLGISASTEKSFFMRSTNVNKDLTTYTSKERAKAFAIEHQGRYYLFIGNMVYIADSRFKAYESNRLDTSFEYEWWIWDSVEACVAYSFDGRLYIGSKEGSVSLFNEEYIDIHKQPIARGQMVYDGLCFTFDDSLGISEGDEISLEYADELISTRSIVLMDLGNGQEYKCTLRYGDIFNSSKEVRLYKGMQLMLYMMDTELGQCTSICPLTILSINYSSGEMVLFNKSFMVLPTGDVALYLAKRVRDSYRVAYNEGYKLSDGDREVRFIGYENIKATLIKRQAVVATLYTCALNFGTSLRSKNLYKMSLTPSLSTIGNLKMGYETNKSLSYKDGYKDEVSGRAIDFDSISFDSLSFGNGFYRSLVRRCFERGFNYIIFKFEHTGNGDFGIEDFSCIYSINNELRSDR
ncbi:MAG: hypothetical protein IJW54_05905 [Clostridia bacterium]|nr:hypothetical protein [Clostridia bacterium]